MDLAGLIASLTPEQRSGLAILASHLAPNADAPPAPEWRPGPTLAEQLAAEPAGKACGVRGEGQGGVKLVCVRREHGPDREHVARLGTVEGGGLITWL